MADISHFLSPASVLAASALDAGHLVRGPYFVESSTSLVARPFAETVSVETASAAFGPATTADAEKNETAVRSAAP